MKYSNIGAMLVIAISSSFMVACDTDKYDDPTITEQTGDNYDEDDNDNEDDDEDDEPSGRWRKCEWCDGTGVCHLCHGDGWLADDRTPCISCDTEDGVCENCHGVGKVFY